MLNSEKTQVFTTISPKECLKLVKKSLEEKGYNPNAQLAGYLITGDPAYIPRHNDARNIIRLHEREVYLELLLDNLF